MQSTTAAMSGNNTGDLAYEMTVLSGQSSNDREDFESHCNETVGAKMPSAVRRCPHCHTPNTKIDASPQCNCVRRHTPFTWANAAKQKEATSITPTAPLCSGALPSGGDEGYASSTASNSTMKPQPTKPSKKAPMTEFERFCHDAQSKAGWDNKPRRNPKRRPRRTSSPSSWHPPANYTALEPERFPVEDMNAAYAAMAAHNSRADYREKAPQRDHQQKLAEANCWQKFAYRMQCKPCWEQSEGCCFMSVDRGEDGTGVGHADGCCVHYGCRDPCCKMGAQHCAGGACCEGCGCVRCFGWEHGIWNLCDNWFGGWTWLCCGPVAKADE
jgi:hypothetical protein